MFDKPASHWRERAEEAQTKAENMTSAQGRDWMLEIAALYRKLANKAAERETLKKNADSN